MRSNRKHTLAELANFIDLFENGQSFIELRDHFGLSIDQSAFNQYYLKYLEHGLAGLESTIKNNSYSEEFKSRVVQEYLEQEGTYKGLAGKYNIPAPSTVKRWVIKYTKGEQLKDYHPKPEVYTMKNQAKNQQEKIAIVKDFLATGMSYRQTAEKHHVSYNNVYSWVEKYKQHGPDGLIDNRGRRKPNHIQTEAEKLQTENTALKARNEYLETENAALKKLKEVERELMLNEHNMKQNSKRLKS